MVRNSKNKGTFFRRQPAAKENGRASLPPKVSSNPFDAKFNREKSSVVGKRQRAHGKPGESKRKQIDKRAKTLLHEFKGTKRIGVFEDSRLGESNPALTSDEKMFLRYAAERKKSYEKKAAISSTVSLQESDPLDSLSINNKKPTERSYGGISERAVAEVHFGKGGDNSNWRDHLDRLIAESKLSKHERHAERFETNDRVDELDEDWSALRGAVLAAGAPPEPQPPGQTSSVGDHPLADPFDRTMKELRFEKCPDHHRIADALTSTFNSEKRRMRFQEETEARMFVSAHLVKPAVHISADALEEDIVAVKRKTATKKKSNIEKNVEPSPSVYRNIDEGELEFTDLLSIDIASSLQLLHSKLNPEFHPDNKDKLIHHMNHYIVSLFSATKNNVSFSSKCLLSETNKAINLLFDFFGKYAAIVEPFLHATISDHLRLFCSNSCFNFDQMERCYCFLKVVVSIFPASDAFHTIMTPAFSLLAACFRYLTRMWPSLGKDNCNISQMICLGVALIDLGVGFISRSHRYFPEILSCFVLIFDAVLKQMQLPSSDAENTSCPRRILPCQHNSIFFLERLLHIAASLFEYWSDIPGNAVFLKNISECLQKLISQSTGVLSLSESLETNAKALAARFESDSLLVPLKINKKVKSADSSLQPLPSFMPVIKEDKLVGRKQKESAAAKTTRLRRQIRKEYRHAVRELRRDNEFLARHTLRERLVVDEERERKTRRIIGQLAMQEGECRKFNRT